MSRGAFDTTGIAVAMALVVGFSLGGLLGANASRSARRELAAARDSLRLAMAERDRDHLVHDLGMCKLDLNGVNFSLWIGDTLAFAYGRFR